MEGKVLSGDWEVAPEELELARGFGEKRMREFLSGRTYARWALRTLELACPPISRNPDGSPAWPEGVVGSISHTRDYCAVAVAPKMHFHGLGLDVEDLHSVNQALRNRICTKEESDQLVSYGDAERMGQLTFLFSAKEAFYKLQVPMTGTWVGFQDVTVSKGKDGRFTVRLLKDIGPGFLRGDQFPGRYWYDDRRVFTLMGLP